MGFKGQRPWPSSLKWYGVKEFTIKKNPEGKPHNGECIEAFGDWVLYNKSFLNTVEESSKVLRLIIALYESSKTSKKEKVEKL